MFIPRFLSWANGKKLNYTSDVDLNNLFWVCFFLVLYFLSLFYIYLKNYYLSYLTWFAWLIWWRVVLILFDVFVFLELYHNFLPSSCVIFAEVIFKPWLSFLSDSIKAIDTNGSVPSVCEGDTILITSKDSLQYELADFERWELPFECTLLLNSIVSSLIWTFLWGERNC